MKYLAKILLTLGFLAVSSTAFAQGVTRVCQESVNSVTGQNNCTDVSATWPFYVQGSNATPIYVKPGAYTPLGYQQITAGTLASSTPLTVPANATIAIVQAEAAGVRWRDDGTAPTATVGMILPANGPPMIFSGAAELAAVAFILQSGSPILDISYYR